MANVRRNKLIGAHSNIPKRIYGVYDPMTNVRDPGNLMYQTREPRNYVSREEMQERMKPASQRVIDLQQTAGGTYQGDASNYYPPGALVHQPSAAFPEDYDFLNDPYAYGATAVGALGLGLLTGQILRNNSQEQSEEEKAVNIASALSPEQLQELNVLLASARQ